MMGANLEGPNSERRELELRELELGYEPDRYSPTREAENPEPPPRREKNKTGTRRIAVDKKIILLIKAKTQLI